jgi:hypothetical protein
MLMHVQSDESQRYGELTNGIVSCDVQAEQKKSSSPFLQWMSQKATRGLSSLTYHLSPMQYLS